MADKALVSVVLSRQNMSEPPPRLEHHTVYLHAISTNLYNRALMRDRSQPTVCNEVYTMRKSFFGNAVFLIIGLNLA